MNEVLDYYENRTSEDERIIRDPLEFIRSKEVISRYLTKEGMNIADVGGASGVYSFWLAGLGHNVHLLDLTPRHIEQAKAKAQSAGCNLAEYVCADARKLPLEDDAFDIVLEMGPLYHLQDRAERVACLKEAFRILKSGCPIICSIISRYASMVDGFKFSLVKDENFRSILDCDFKTGCHNNPSQTDHYFTTAFFHTPDEIRSELYDAGFTDVNLFAVEGFANILDMNVLIQDSDMKSTLLDYLRRTEDIPELLGMSGHILAIGYKK